jgi:hypothetical protein
MKLRNVFLTSASLAITGLLLSGCTGGSSDNAESTSIAKPVESGTATAAVSGADTTDSSPPPVAGYAPIQLPGSSGTSSSVSSEASGSTTVSTAPPKVDDIIAGLKPLQIVLGDWTGIVQKASSNEGHAWVWDLKSDPQFPALVLDSMDGVFFKEARLTFDPRDQNYHMTTKDADGTTRKFSGTFSKEPEDVPNENGKGTHRTFKLELSETTDPPLETRFQFVFNQQDNNRYLVEISRARGKAPFRRVDTIGTQREGVSFAQADDDYGDRTCVISGGLGTSTVSYKGKSYYVCCSGCKAAFEDEPERWIARFEAEKKKKAEMLQ